MTSKTLRKVQPAHRSENVTVREARNAWLKNSAHSTSRAGKPGTTGESGDRSTSSHDPEPGRNRS